MRIKDARQTFVGIWIRLLLEGKPFDVWGGEQLRDFTFVEDCIDAMLLAASSEKANGKIYNLGGKEIVSLRNLADHLIKINKKGTFVVKEFPEERKKIDIGDYYSDFSLISEELGWAPETPIEEALQKTIDFFRANLEYYL